MSQRSALDPADRAVELLRRLEAQKTGEPLAASPVERVVSRLIDVGFALVLFVVLGLVGGGLIWLVEPPESGETVTSGPFGATVSLVGTAIFLLAVVGNELRAGITGQTLGKRLYSLTLTDAVTREPPGIRRAAIRTAIWLIPLATCAALSAATFPGTLSWLFFAGALASLALPLWMFLDRDHRGLHDILTGTAVRLGR